MIADYAQEIETEVQYFLEKFIANGWKQEDTAYITKQVDIITSPNTKNKNGLGLVLYPNLLSYSEKDSESYGSTKIWIACRATISDIEDKYPIDERAYDIAKLIRKECEDIGIKLFHDEDAFGGYFSKQFNKHNEMEIKCYFNKDYPTGYWENHTL